MRAQCKIFDESAAHQNVYLREGTSVRFPIKFCETRWIEDGEVAERASGTQRWTGSNFG